MADLEEHAFRRDRRFVVRVVLGVLVAFVVGGIIYGKLTSTEVGACAADSFGDIAEPEAEQ